MTEAEALRQDWETNPRWEGIVRPYAAEDVLRLRPSLKVVYSLAEHGAKKLWHLFDTEPYVPALGSMTGQQAAQMAKAGLKAIYCSGWQVAADANRNQQTFPDQSIYDPSSVPTLVRRMNNALTRADQIKKLDGPSFDDWYLPIIADGEAGGGTGNVFSLMWQMIEAGVAAVHLEDQLGSEKKCGHLGGKVLVPARQHIKTLVAARFTADVMGVPTVIIARTDAESASLITSEIDDRDQPFILGTDDATHEEMSYAEARKRELAGEWTRKGVQGKWTPSRTEEGHYKIKPGLNTAIMRALAYAPYADLLWMETKTPDLEDAKLFAQAIHAKFPGKFLAYNCSPSFNWFLHWLKIVGRGILSPEETAKVIQAFENKELDKLMADSENDFSKRIKVVVERVFYEIAMFQRKLGEMGYKFQFVTLAGFHAVCHTMFKLAKDYEKEGMAAYVRLQQEEFVSQKDGYEAVKHQREVGTGFFDEVSRIVSGGTSSTTAMKGSTEADQFGK